MQQLGQEALGPWHPVSGGPWTAALKQEVPGAGLIVFRSLNKCLVGWLISQLCVPRSHHQLGRAGDQLRLCKGQGRGASRDGGVEVLSREESVLFEKQVQSSSWWIPLCMSLNYIWKEQQLAVTWPFLIFTLEASPTWGLYVFWCGQPWTSNTEE